MSMRVLSIAVLLFLVGAVSSAHNGRLVSRRFPQPCCPTVYKADISGEVTGDSYRELSARTGCLNAVLLTVQHREVCVDPKEEWVQKLIANMTKV